MADNLPTVRHQESGSPIVAPNLSPQAIDQLISNQARDLELKAAELSLQQQKDSNGFTYAMKALEAQAADRRDDRVHQRRMRNTILIFSSIIAVVIALVIGYSLTTGHEGFASELLKLVGYVGVGVFGGYGFANRNRKSSQNDDSDNSEE